VITAMPVLAEVAAGVGAARHFQIDHAVDEIVARDEFLLDLLDARGGFRQRQLDLADRAFQPRQMRGIVDQLAVQHGGDLIDAVGKQEAAIENRDLRLRERDERAVDVCDLFQGRVS
jgi:hypothetical protein